MTKPRFLLVYPLVLLIFLRAHTTEPMLVIGILVALLGEAIRVWANGYVGHVKVNWTQKGRDEPKIGRLITNGPYAFVRHPLYVGTFLIGAGFCILVGSVWGAPVALAFFLLVYRRKMAEEEALLQDELGEPYQRYQAAVPRWIPTVRRYADRQGVWSWQGIVASKEWKTIIWILVTVIALYLREEVIQERTALGSSRGLKLALWFGVILVLVVCDGLFELRSRRARRVI